MTLRDSFVLNAFGDAACALTPLRIGGEPARLAGMLRSRVPATAAFVGISLEVLAAWPVIIVAAGWLAGGTRPPGGCVAGPRLARRRGRRPGPGSLAVALVERARLAVRRGRVASPAARQLRRPVRRAMVYWRRMPRWPLVASIPHELRQPGHPGRHPAGAGAHAARARRRWARWRSARSRCSTASSCCRRRPAPARSSSDSSAGRRATWGADEGWLLLAWRFYTNGIGVLLGVWLARDLGWPAIYGGGPATRDGRLSARRWRDRHQHHGPLQRLATPCGTSAGAQTTVPGPDLARLVAHRHPRPSADDQIELVGARHGCGPAGTGPARSS